MAAAVCAACSQFEEPGAGEFPHSRGFFFTTFVQFTYHLPVEWCYLLVHAIWKPKDVSDLWSVVSHTFNPSTPRQRQADSEFKAGQSGLHSKQICELFAKRTKTDMINEQQKESEACGNISESECHAGYFWAGQERYSELHFCPILSLSQKTNVLLLLKSLVTTILKELNSHLNKTHVVVVASNLILFSILGNTPLHLAVMLGNKGQ